MINADAYYRACKIKEAQFFVLFIKNLEYLIQTEVRQVTNPKGIVLEEYDNLLNIFSKKDSNILLSQEKQDYKIILKKEQKYDHTHLYKM